MTSPQHGAVVRGGEQPIHFDQIEKATAACNTLFEDLVLLSNAISEAKKGEKPPSEAPGASSSVKSHKRRSDQWYSRAANATTAETIPKRFQPNAPPHPLLWRHREASIASRAANSSI